MEGEFETDTHRLEQRAKQVARCKATLGYKLSKPHRKRNRRLAPPSIYKKCSKRAWVGALRVWKLEMHAYEPKTEPEWYSAYERYPRETLQLAWQLVTDSKHPNVCLPPDDLVKKAALGKFELFFV